MTKHEFLAMSLPYGLKIYSRSLIDDRLNSVINLNAGNLHECNLSRNLPICRPLSDLTKEIEHDCEILIPFIPRNWIMENIYPDLSLSLSIEEGFCDIDQYTSIIQKLIEWHFDIAGLIEKGEAIDVNTLEINPYK